MFDHHHDPDRTYKSAFEAVLNYQEGFDKLKSYLGSSSHDVQAEVVFHVHAYPDLDCIASVYAIQKMIRSGTDMPRTAFKLDVLTQFCEYINAIDSGKKKNMSSLTLYAYICLLGKDKEGTVLERSRRFMEDGLKLLEMVDEALESKDAIDLYNVPLENYIDPEKLSRLGSLSAMRVGIQKMNDGYQKDKLEGRVVFKELNLWKTGEKDKGEFVPVKAAIWEELPSDEDEYVLAREKDRCVLTVYPEKIRKEDSDEGVTKVIIALNPDLPESEEFTLLPLVEVLERCEQQEEDILFSQRGRYRRGHSRARAKEGILSKAPFRETSDPWFILPTQDLIDAPRAGSILPYARVLSILENSSYITKKASIVRFKITENADAIVQASLESEHTAISFGKLNEEIRETLERLQKKDDTVHLFVFLEADPAMVQNSNRWLRTCCLNMAGRNDDPVSADNILGLNYRTCLYTDQAVTIMTAVDNRNDSLGRLIAEDLPTSRICQDLSKLLTHRQELRNIGNGFSELVDVITQETEPGADLGPRLNRLNAQVDEFNTRLVRLNAQIVQDDMITDSLEQEVYAFIKKMLGIEELRNSVTMSARLLIKKAEQHLHLVTEDREKKEERAEKKRDERIQAGIGLVTVLALFSALTDAFDFISTFNMGSEGGWCDLWVNHPGIFWAEAAFAVFILIIGIIGGKYAVKALWDAHKKDTEMEQT